MENLSKDEIAKLVSMILSENSDDRSLASEIICNNSDRINAYQWRWFAAFSSVPARGDVESTCEKYSPGDIYMYDPIEDKTRPEYEKIRI